MCIFCLGGDRFEIVKPHADSLHFQEPLISSFISHYFWFLHQVYLSPELMGQQQLHREIITPLLNWHWKSSSECKFFTFLFSLAFIHFTLLCCSPCLSCVTHCSPCHRAQWENTMTDDVPAAVGGCRLYICNGTNIELVFDPHTCINATEFNDKREVFYLKWSANDF